MTEFKKLPIRVRRVIDMCRSGERLVKTLAPIDADSNKPRFHLEPSARRVQPKLAQEAIDSGYLAPASDGLFGDEFSQTFSAS